MVAGGTEAAVCPCAIAGFGALTALSPSDDPEKCSLPFEKNRSGFVLGEGAGIVVLEELEHAKARGAKIYAEVVGYGCSADAYHITSPLEDGAGAARAMQNAIEDAGVDKNEITYINAHGTATHHRYYSYRSHRQLHHWYIFPAIPAGWRHFLLPCLRSSMERKSD